jgi:hypothetical protein
MTAPRQEVPRYVYRYLVTASTESTVPVGTSLVDQRRELVKAWEFIDMVTGASSYFVGERRGRCCSECHALHRLARDYGHEGEHGEGAPYTPDPGRSL